MMEYKVVEAQDSAEAMRKSGFVIGAPVIVTKLTASVATGNDRYSVFPAVRGLSEEEMAAWQKFVKSDDAPPSLRKEFS